MENDALPHGQYYSSLYGELPLECPQMMLSLTPYQDTLCSTTINENSISSTKTTSNRIELSENVPFVQIHSIDVQPDRSGFNNMFRPNNSQEEIKSEPIKSESTDTSKENAVASPTLQLSNSVNMNATLDQTAFVDSNKETLFPKVFKCSKCPFISVSASKLNLHVRNIHNNEGNGHPTSAKLNCPGCSNIFYVRKSLETHLLFDHLTTAEDIRSILSELDKYIAAEKKDKATCTSKIYLKNVECLKKPLYGSMEQINNIQNNYRRDSSNDITPKESNTSNIELSTPIKLNNRDKNAETCNKNSTTNRLKQKIFIKSVDVLREPELQRQNYEMATKDNLVNTMPESCYSYLSPAPHSISYDANSNNNDVYQMHRQPKIYIKNVDILKEHTPYLDQQIATGVPNIHSSIKNMFMSQTNVSNVKYFDKHHESSQSYESQVGNISGNFVVNHSVNNNNSIQICDSVNDNFCNITGNDFGNLMLENSTFSNALDCDLETLQSETIPATIESTPLPSYSGVVLPHSLLEHIQPTSPVTMPQKQKIFIKNVDILKDPQFQEQQRGTLHLRTVDELNLMNRNEVESLIKPNLEWEQNETGRTLNEVYSVSSDITDKMQKFPSETIFTEEWPMDEYNLSDNIDCVVPEQVTPLSTMCCLKNNHDLNTPQTSIITIRDIEELTGTHTQNYNSTTNIPTSVENLEDHIELLSSTNNIQQTKCSSEKNESNKMDKSTSLSNIPPLAPVTNSSNCSPCRKPTILNKVSKIPIPPLVPVRPVNQLQTSDNCSKLTSLAASTSDKRTQFNPIEKGRIYVSSNLLEPSKNTDLAGKKQIPPENPIAVTVTSGTSVRGRPFGSKSTGITKMRKLYGTAVPIEVGLRCFIRGCAFRFKKSETLDYHIKCHNSEENSHCMICPECNTTEFTNWNTLHTHLWRNHQIDMELYSCELCTFKTPIYSRLVNTHSKIHYEVRNYKCDQCEKAFKNSKQLKNHRRWHRKTNPAIKNSAEQNSNTVYHCKDCSAVFSHAKTLRQHLCKNSCEAVHCEICQRTVTSKSSLKLHMRTHETEKRLKCENCKYTTSDHNAIRRHKMTHTIQRPYNCPYCDCKFIQSATYQKHINQKHADRAQLIIHKCSHCTFSTIKLSLFALHQAKHDESSVNNDS